MLHIKIFSFTQILLEDPLYLSLTPIFYHQSDFWHERRRCSRLQLAVDFLTLFMIIWNFSNDVCSMVILTLQLLFHVNPFYFRYEEWKTKNEK